MEILGGLGVWEVLILGVFLIVPFGLWLIVIIDVLANKFRGNEKLLWFLLVFFGSFPGALIYLIVGRPKRLRTKRVSEEPSLA